MSATLLDKSESGEDMALESSSDALSIIVRGFRKGMAVTKKPLSFQLLSAAERLPELGYEGSTSKVTLMC